VTARLAALGVLLAVAGAAHAQAPGSPAPDAGVDLCLPLRIDNARLGHQLDLLGEKVRADGAALQQLQAQLRARAQSEAALERTLGRTKGQLDEACRSTDALALSLLQSQPVPAGARACVAPAHAEAIDAFEKSLAGTLSAIDGLRDYADGESDRMPRLPRPDTDIEAAMARLLGDPREPPLLDRRLLAEAAARVAPHFWAALRAKPGREAALWLQGKGPLDAAFIDEVRRTTLEDGDRDASTPTAPVAGLELTRAFRELAGCAGKHPPAGCARAEAMEELLETSSPLLVERRAERIWATDCRTLSPVRLDAWFAELPGTPRLAQADWSALEDAAYAKLYGCFLGSSTAGGAFGSWLSAHLPAASDVSGPVFAHVSAVRDRFVRGGDDDLCAQAVRALQALPSARRCALSAPQRDALSAWHPPSSPPRGLAPTTCARMAELLWQGHSAEVPAAFGRSPERADVVRVEGGEGGAAKLRALCDDRRGAFEAFPGALQQVAQVAARWGDDPALPPWRAAGDPPRPLEQARLARATTLSGWTHARLRRITTCQALGISAERCARCVVHADPARYDCEARNRVRASWSAWDRRAAAALGAGVLLVIAGLWLFRLGRARSRYAAWLAGSREALARAGLRASARRLRHLLPRRYRMLVLELPRGPDWERWGKRAAVVRAERGGLSARDVDEAASLTRAVGSELCVLVHDEDASPELGAVRAMLDWAVRGAQAVQVLPATRARLEWVRSAGDLLDLVEQTSLRGNPFEVRGRITSASQFFDRERLVSGLLAGIQAGTWTLITGLRRMGKSSLALEVARQLNGPSAYVDFAGFHHELAHAPGDAAASAVLRYLCIRLAESARERLGLTLAPPPEGDLDSSRLAAWMAAFNQACFGGAGARGGHAIIIFDELEQAIGTAPGRVDLALDVLATVLGRLRTALGTPTAGSTRVGVLLCGAIHPFLWSPLTPLAGGTLMSALPRLVVPRLDDDAAAMMMRGLGARQGIRFTEEALELMIREAQGIPLLVRRLGSSVLELYDPERARQGGLGAVEVGREGALAAVKREEDEGAPLRVWVESEIGDWHSPAGQVLRRLARSGQVAAPALREVARDETLRQLRLSGLAALLDERELARRADEAGSATLQLLVETGLVHPVGDLTRPEAYRLPDGLLRRILARAGSSGPFELPR